MSDRAGSANSISNSASAAAIKSPRGSNPERSGSEREIPGQGCIGLPIEAGNHAVARFVQRKDDVPPSTAATIAPPDDVKLFESPIENLFGMLGTKKSLKGSFKLPVDNKTFLGGYVAVEGLTGSAEAGLEVARSGNGTVLSTTKGGSVDAKRNPKERQNEIESKGKAIGLDLKTTHAGLLNAVIEFMGGKPVGTSGEMKWLGLDGMVDKDGKLDSAGLGFEITEKMEFAFEDGFSFTPSVSLSVNLASVDLKNHKIAVAGAAVNIAGEGAKKSSLPPLDIAGFRTPKFDKTISLKVSGSVNARLNEKKVGRKLLEFIGKQAAGRVAPTLLKVVQGLESPAAKMITGGVMTVCNVLDAYIEGDRQKNLGELAANMPYVYGGGFMNGFANTAVSAPATAQGPVSQFQSAGQAAGKRAKADAIERAKTAPGAADFTAVELEKGIDELLKEKPLGLEAIAVQARKPVDEYVLNKFVETRTNGATDVFDFLGNTDHKIDPKNPEASQEYRHFRDRVLKAYTTRTNDPYYSDTAIKNAYAAADKEGVPPEKLQAWLANYMQGKAQGAIDSAEPDTRMDALMTKKKLLNDLLGGWVSDEDIRKVQPIVLNTPKEAGRQELLVICRSWKPQLNAKQAKLLSDLTGA
jgi:hypothetical protein